jgi:hypothetical protein
MMKTKIMSATANNDAELVSGTLAGNRDTFGQIVSRYQSLGGITASPPNIL